MDRTREIKSYVNVKYIPPDEIGTPFPKHNNAFASAIRDIRLAYIEGYIRVKTQDGNEKRRHAWVFDPNVNIAYEFEHLPLKDLSVREMIPADRVEYYGYEITQEERSKGLQSPGGFVLHDDDLIPIYETLTREET
jgi:hypothetical protein